MATLRVGMATLVVVFAFSKNVTPAQQRIPHVVSPAELRQVVAANAEADFASLMRCSAAR